MLDAFFGTTVVQTTQPMPTHTRTMKANLAIETITTANARTEKTNGATIITKILLDPTTKVKIKTKQTTINTFIIQVATGTVKENQNLKQIPMQMSTQVH